MPVSNRIAAENSRIPMTAVPTQLSPLVAECGQSNRPVDDFPSELVTTRGTVSLAAFKRNADVTARSSIIQGIWILIGSPLLAHRGLPFSGWRVWLLHLFGAQIGTGVNIKRGFRVRYPWKLKVGNNCWIGEECWMDNWEEIAIANDVCISQNAYLCTGNHDWTHPAFAMHAKSITVRDGAWIASKCVIAPGVTIGVNGIACIGSVVLKDIPDGEIHSGNPACFRLHREIHA
jgi:putative colanic acid biosynthesis acetyltransferase WcaF